MAKHSEIAVFMAIVAILSGCGGGDVSSDSGSVKPTIQGVYLPEPVIACLIQAGRIEYLPDKPGQDYWQSPAETAERGKGDCEDLAIYLQYLLRRRGLDAEVVFGLKSLASTTGHCWCEFRHEGATYILEPRNGSAYRRDRLPKAFYIRADGVEVVERKKANYQKRTGLELNASYDKESSPSNP